MKIGFLFPGQGAQTIGMGKDLYDTYDCIKEIYAQAKDITKIDIANITFQGSEKTLSKTQNTQLAILTMSLGILTLLKENGIDAEYAAGLSLGEYTALTYGETFNVSDVFRVIQKRGEFMENFTPEGEWKMVAIIGLKDEVVENICQNVIGGFAVPANYNCPGQITVSGDKEGIEQVTQLAKSYGAKHIIPLKTNGPFHTEQLSEASKALKAVLEPITIQFPKCHVIKNLDGTPYDTSDDIKEILAKHIVNPVKFAKSITYMLNHGVDTFIEIGPGKILTGFVKKMNKEVTCLNIHNVTSLENVITMLS